MKPKSLSHKIAAVRRVRSEMKKNPQLTLRAACKLAGVPLSSFQTWAAKVDAAGADESEALKPKYANCGRKAKWELDDAERTALRGLVLLRDSVTFAVEEFITREECRPETRQAILDEMDLAAREKRYCRWPISLRQLIASTVEERKLLRGSRSFESISFSPRKGLFFVDGNGDQIPLRPHTAWTMDDYSTNEPYQIEGARLCRQTLAAMDIYSDAWLSVEMIGRERDAYRAEDILRFILRTIDGAGTMPEYLLLELGSWDSTPVHGLDMGNALKLAKYEGRCWGGLDELFTIIHGHSSRHKAALESSFNILQRAVAHSGTSIGRKRGEFEQQTKAFLAIQTQAKLIASGGTPKKLLDATAKGFLTQDASREVHWQAMQYLNGRGKHRAATGTVEVPADLMSIWDEAEARPLPDSERWRFLPCKRLVTVRGGFIETSVAPYRQPFRFQVNGLVSGPNLTSGYRLFIAFDPAMPGLGAYVANAETETANREGWGLGQFLLHAPHAADAPQFTLGTGGYADSSKRRADTAARTSFASVNPLRRRGLAVTQRHDGQGNATVARTGARSAQDGITSTGASAVRDPLDLSQQDTEQRSSSTSRPTPSLSSAAERRATLAELEAAAEDHLPAL